MIEGPQRFVRCEKILFENLWRHLPWKDFEGKILAVLEYLVCHHVEE